MSLERAASEAGTRVSGAARRPAALPARSARSRSVPQLLPNLGELADPSSYLGHHSRSFRFAAGMMPRVHRARIARIYAWCRYTDNLVDGDEDGPDLVAARLDRWLACSRLAYDGGASGVRLVDVVMREMAEGGVPFAYAHDLVRAMRSDLQFRAFEDLDSLRVYCYRAAGVVGRWLTELHGVRDEWMLERAALLGGAMQLTNILRDVGEDWDRGRVYLPTSVLRSHELTLADIGAMRRGEQPIDGRYRRAVEELMAVATDDYRLAREAIPHLPSTFRRAVAVASAVYEGIQGVIRRNGYDNLRRRAYTSAARKLALASGALLGLAFGRAVSGTRP